MHVYEVGKPYNPAVREWPERVEYNWRDGAHEMLMSFRALTPREIEDIQRGPLELALFTAFEGEQLFLLYKTGLIPWSDTPYTYHRVPKDQQQLPDDQVPGNMLLTIILVSAEDGIIRAIRVVTLPQAFVRTLHAAIRAQAALPFNQATYDQHLSQLYLRHTSGRMAQQASARAVFPGHQ